MTARALGPRYTCVHGHFYQPPREDPRTGRIGQQEGAEPYHDWNEKITAECYAPNSRARILGADGETAEVVNNYSKISFNFGPTLLRWLQDAEPEIYQAVLNADRFSRGRFSGHGSAIAQVYHHSILPLANRRDKITEVIWGIRDFVHRFSRRPEGIWLAETAVDTETLEVLVDAGIKFTILSPFQAKRVRRERGRHWTEVDDGSVDSRPAYQVHLPSKRSIVVFFYNAAVAKDVAFNHLLSDGEAFAQRLLEGLQGLEDSGLSHIATDGESYGHHHQFGEMALAYALKRIEQTPDVQPTVYGEFLERHPPRWAAEIIDNTSWSCVHGVERWRSDCGCQTGSRPGWTQAWREPLREGLNWLRDEIAPHYETAAGRLLEDPWEARNESVSLLLGKPSQARREFFSAWARHPLTAYDENRALQLLELQRNALMMFTSCGWFFNDISGIETIQILRYAGRVLELAKETLEVDLREQFLERLALAESNLPEEGTGRDIFERYVSGMLTKGTRKAEGRR